MKQIEGISINIGVTIPEETVQRCIAILNMFLTDNPNIEIEVHEAFYDNNKERYLMLVQHEGEK